MIFFEMKLKIINFKMNYCSNLRKVEIPKNSNLQTIIYNELIFCIIVSKNVLCELDIFAPR